MSEQKPVCYTDDGAPLFDDGSGGLSEYTNEEIAAMAREDEEADTEFNEIY